MRLMHFQLTQLLLAGMMGRLLRAYLSNAEVQGGDARLIDTSSRNSDESIAEGKFFVVYKRRIYSSMRYIVLVAEIGQSVVVKEA